MAGVTSIEVKESVEDLVQRLRETPQSPFKERLQVLYWLKQAHAPSIRAIAQAVGKHRGTVHAWLSIYREQGLEGLLERKPPSAGAVRVIPPWVEAALAKRLQDPEQGFDSYGAVQAWLAETFGVEAKYHTVYHLTRYRLQAKLKVVRPQNRNQNPDQREAFKKTSRMT